MYGELIAEYIAGWLIDSVAAAASGGRITVAEFILGHRCRPKHAAKYFGEGRQAD